MPLWIIYHPPNAFTTPSSKKALAAGITEIYTSSAGLPAFYVNIFFQSIETSSFYIGGVSRPSPDKDANGNERPLIRITIQHIARTL
jgi:phenylpyruvate tautomerase PptA (4-oxalocrotonate tautomerase family)